MERLHGFIFAFYSPLCQGYPSFSGACATTTFGARV
jgi:hypothetical protein